MRLVISILEFGRRACSLQHVQAALDNVSQAHFGIDSGVTWRVDDVHGSSQGCWACYTDKLAGDGEKMGTLEAVRTGARTDRPTWCADLLKDLRHRTGGTRCFLTLDDLPPTGTPQETPAPREAKLAEAQRLMTEVFNDLGTAILKAGVSKEEGQYYTEQHLRLARQELCNADLNVRLALADLDMATKGEAADSHSTGNCDRCGECFQTGQEIAEVAVEGGESIVIHQSCMRPGEDIA